MVIVVFLEVVAAAVVFVVAAVLIMDQKPYPLGTRDSNGLMAECVLFVRRFPLSLWQSLSLPET